MTNDATFSGVRVPRPLEDLGLHVAPVLGGIAVKKGSVAPDLFWHVSHLGFRDLGYL